MNWRNQLSVERGAPGRSVYRVEISPAADRDPEKLKGRIRMQDFERLLNTVRSLVDNPRPRRVRKVRGTENAYRVRVGNYGVVYDVYDRDDLVLVLQVARRSETTYGQVH
jgi:mRNA interferase RelE/StbE